VRGCGNLLGAENGQFKKNYVKMQIAFFHVFAYACNNAMLSIERELAEKLDFHSLINNFATRKARKCHM